MKKLSVLLVGTANSGKSTLFYSLTHKKVDIGNRAGVTVSEKEGKIKGDTKNVSLNLVDLPGIYSLAPHTKDEFLTVKRLEEANADIILNVLDVTSLEGGLALTLELRRRFPDTPVVLALNMTDELRAKKLSVDEEKLSKLLGVFAISISAIKGEGLDRLKETLIKADGLRTPCRYFGSVSSLALSVLKKRNGERLSQREYRESMLSGDRITDRLDRILLSRSLGIPIFLAIFALVFFISFGKVGSAVSDSVSLAVITPLEALAKSVLTRFSAAPWLYSLISDGIITGVCAVLGFLPGILIFSLCLSLLEDSGYLSRVAFLFDAPLRRVGLSGRTAVPVLLGFGCTVSSVLAVRNLTEKRERRLCTVLLPLISCSARSPLYLAFGATLFGEHSWLLCFFLYLLGVACFIFGTAVFNTLSGTPKAPALAIELPKYRLPRMKVISLKLKGQISHFLRRAGTVIFLSSVITWLASSFSLGFELADGENESILLRFSSFISPFFAPLGFRDPRLVASLLGGLSAKESALSTICILFETANVSLSALISEGVLTVPSALSFIVFFSLYFPCFPALTAIFEETKKLRHLLFCTLSCLTFAYACAALTYNFALFLL